MTALYTCIRPVAAIFILANAFFSCNNAPDTAQATATVAATPAGKTLTLDVFSQFPPEIDGCACYFSEGEEAFSRNAWLYADDYVNTAFLSINGEMTRFSLTDSATPSETRTVKTFRHDAYELTLDITQVGQLDETWQQKGKLVLKAKDGTEISRDIYGECGC